MLFVRCFAVALLILVLSGCATTDEGYEQVNFRMQYLSEAANDSVYASIEYLTPDILKVSFTFRNFAEPAQLIDPEFIFCADRSKLEFRQLTAKEVTTLTLVGSGYHFTEQEFLYAETITTTSMLQKGSVPIGSAISGTIFWQITNRNYPFMLGVPFGDSPHAILFMPEHYHSGKE